MNKFVLDDSMYQGYIKLWRKVRDWAFFQKPLALALWVTLLCEANHRPTRKFFKGKIIVIEPGQLLTGRKYLAEMVGISESSVEKYLKQFEEEQQITQQTSSKSRLITIKNWPQYQEGHTAEQTTCYTTKRQQKDNKKTTKRQQKDTPNNDKNDKNGKNGKKEQHICEVVYDFYITTFQRDPSKYKLSANRRAKILSRYREFKSVELLKQAIINRSKSKFHLGDNPQNKKYIDLEDHIFRNFEYTEKLIFDPGLSSEAERDKWKEVLYGKNKG